MNRHSFIIETRYHGPTNTKGARISARFTVGNMRPVFISYPYELYGQHAHKQAALAMLEKNNLKNTLTHYAEHNQGYVFCFE